jgi:hypothetical protein
MICDECETVAHCLKNGCVPKQPPSKDEVLKLALYALENGMKFVWSDPERKAGFDAIDAIKQALAAPVQEPVVIEGGKRLIVVDQLFDDLMYWLDRCEHKGHLENCPDLVEPWSAFQYANYTTPPAAQRQWVGLTDEQIAQLASKYLDVGDGERGATYVYGEIEFARAIEAKLKEKNT